MPVRSSSERRYRQAIEALFLGRRPPRLPGPLGEHLKQCSECRNLYTSLARADRVLGEQVGTPAEVSPFESEMAWEEICAGLDVRVAPAPRASWHVWLPVGAALVLLLAGGAWLLFRSQPGQAPDGFASRGASLHPSLGLYCIEPGETPSIRTPGPSEGDARCRLQETLGFSYLNPDGVARGLMLFAIDGKGNVLPYRPNPADPNPPDLPSAETWTALERTVLLAVNHQPGEYQVVAVFLPRPVTLEQLEEQAPGLAAQGAAPKDGWVIRKTLRIEE